MVDGRGRSPRKGDLVEIRWTDALALHGDWQSRKAARKSRPMPSLAVGYVLRSTSRYVTVAALVNENHVANGITIPQACITGHKVLRRSH